MINNNYPYCQPRWHKQTITPISHRNLNYYKKTIFLLSAHQVMNTTSIEQSIKIPTYNQNLKITQERHTAKEQTQMQSYCNKIQTETQFRQICTCLWSEMASWYRWPWENTIEYISKKILRVFASLQLVSRTPLLSWSLKQPM